MANKTAQITCINKDDRLSPYERIIRVGGTGNGGWRLTQEQAIKHIEDGWQFWVSVQGHSVWVVVGVSGYGNKYLKTANDGEGENNLLSLPECS